MDKARGSARETPAAAAGVPEIQVPEIRPVGSDEFQEILLEWANLHLDADSGLARVECCEALVPKEQVTLFRQEHVISVKVDDSGELLAGFLMRYAAVCPACRELREGERPVPVAEIAARAATLTGPD